MMESKNGRLKYQRGWILFTLGLMVLMMEVFLLHKPTARLQVLTDLFSQEEEIAHATIKLFPKLENAVSRLEKLEASAFTTGNKLMEKSTAQVAYSPSTEAGPPAQFVYVYDIESKYNLDLLAANMYAWSTQYRGEEELYDMLAKKNISRTDDPEKAHLFYIPIFSARYLMSITEDVRQFKKPQQMTSQVWVDVLTDLKTKYPYFNRHNGADHFSAFSMDNGRCSALIYCPPEVYGDMFFLQLNGDLMVRSINQHPVLGLQSLNYNFMAEVATDVPDIPCFMPGRDMVMPVYPLSSQITMPNKTREITALLRFTATHSHQQHLTHYGHILRKEILQEYDGKGLPGWEIGARSEEQSFEEAKNAKFCVCPLGHSQWTSRPIKAILAGCIPITFYRNHEQPWEDLLDYSKFTINIFPDKIATMQDRINDVLAVPGRYKEMQKELAAVQEYFSWDESVPKRVQVNLLNKLKKRACYLRRFENLCGNVSWR